MADNKKTTRRDFLYTATYTIGAVGLGATIWPFIDQMNPDKSVQALATTEVDVSTVEPGNSITVLWRGKPVFLKRRTQEEINEARAVNLKELKDPQKDEDRVKDGKDEWLVMLGVCFLIKEITKVAGFVHAMDLIMMCLEELEKDQHQ